MLRIPREFLICDLLPFLHHCFFLCKGEVVMEMENHEHDCSGV